MMKYICLFGGIFVMSLGFSLALFQSLTLMAAASNPYWPVGTNIKLILVGVITCAVGCGLIALSFKFVASKTTA